MARTRRREGSRSGPISPWRALREGRRRSRDLAQAKSWYQRAADAGNARAMHNLAVLTAEGAGDKPDYAAAAQLFGKAAEFGVRDSQYNLAILYARGLGVEQNLALSYAWFATAARQGDEDAGRKREEIAAKLDPKLLEDAKRTAELFRAKPLERAANEVAPPPGGWDKAESGAVPAPFGGVGVRPIGRPRAG
ncbi:MAG: sel1 repeat family protein [Rhodoblastus sp.]|nr:MAG: sel1 repeat family protein [Rhodoblastus sp.]